MLNYSLLASVTDAIEEDITTFLIMNVLYIFNFFLYLSIGVFRLGEVHTCL